MNVDVFTDALHELQGMCRAACQASHDAAFPLERKYQEGRIAALAAAVYVLESAVLAAGAEGAALPERTKRQRPILQSCMAPGSVERAKWFN